MLGEITNQYAGILPDDPRMEPYWALAEELDMPGGIDVEAQLWMPGHHFFNRERAL